MILITQPRVGTSHNEILALQVAAREAGWDVLSAPSGWRLDDDLIKSGVPGVAYGSQTFAEVISMQMNWQLKANPFDWLSKLPERFLKREVQFMTLGEAKKLKEKKFIKPADDKVFAAAVYEPGTLNPHETVPLDTPTLVSDIVHFELEYRCFVNRFDRVVDWSNYIFFDQIADPRMWKVNFADRQSPDFFVECAVRSLSTEPSVVDVGWIPGKGWAIIETNQAWASGIYGCDPGKVLEVLQQSVVI